MSHFGDLKPEDLSRIDLNPPAKGWVDPTIDFESRRGTWSYPGASKNMKYLGYQDNGEWSPTDADWKLPTDWQKTVLEGMRERLMKYRTFKLFMDTCVRCGACADKCHFFIGSGDPKNMPVLRAELLRSVYRNDFTTFGKLLGGLGGARPLTKDVIKEWYYYFFQCTQCRRCSVFCPYGIDTAEITFFARELMLLIGLTINWIIEPVANCQRTGNHLGLQPHTFKDNVEFMADEMADTVGITPNISFNRKGAEILFITPSADVFADPAIYVLMGYMLVFEHLGLDYTFSSYASEGGNFGSFASHETMKRLNFKMFHEAKRLGVKWILGGECGHMWRVIHQYMATMNHEELVGSKLEAVPTNPVTGTRFHHAAGTKMVHIMEFLADCIQHGKLPLDKSRNDHWTVTYHDSCNPSRGMGLLDEPRYVLNSVVNKFYEMPENTIREQTFCCAGGAGLGNDENMEMRMRGGLPRGNALRHVRDKFGVNMMSCVCAIDKATLPPLAEFWAEGVQICGVTELVGNALVMEGKNMNVDMRGTDIGGGADDGDAEGGDDV
jgi:Fe-S oxidoreductase